MIDPYQRKDDHVIVPYSMPCAAEFFRGWAFDWADEALGLLRTSGAAVSSDRVRIGRVLPCIIRNAVT